MFDFAILWIGTGGGETRSLRSVGRGAESVVGGLFEVRRVEMESEAVCKVSEGGSVEGKT